MIAVTIRHGLDLLGTKKDSSPMDSSRKVALVTGGARGLGGSLTRAFLQKGYRVAVNYFESEEEAAAIAEAAGENGIAVRADVRDTFQAGEMISRIERTYGRLDVVINNAGITRDSLIMRQSEEEWDAVINTNLTGCFHVIRAAAPLIMKSGGGHILNISSYSGLKGSAGQAAYSAAKAGAIGLTVSAAQELAGQNIRVNAVLPGYMLTDMGSKSPRAAEKAREESILHVLSDPAAIARSIVLFVEMDYITGQLLILDSRII